MTDLVMNLAQLIDLLEAQRDGLGWNWRINRSYLNEMIADAVYGPAVPSRNADGSRTLYWWHGGVGRSIALDFVGSLDAAIPSERIYHVHRYEDGRTKWEAEAVAADGSYHRSRGAATEALARRAAALRAREAA